jgi:WD40 repeat protein
VPTLPVSSQPTSPATKAAASPIIASSGSSELLRVEGFSLGNTLTSRETNNARILSNHKTYSTQPQNGQKPWISVLGDDILTHILFLLDISCNLNVRGVCKRFHNLSKNGMEIYWIKAWSHAKGTRLTRDKAITSSSLWKQEFKWLGLAGNPVITTLSGHKGSVTALAFAALNDREFLVSGSDDGSLIVWCTNEIKNIDDDSDVAKPIIMQHHHRQSKKGTISRLHSLTGHHGPVWGVSVHRNRVCSGSFDKTIKIWELASGNCLHTLRGHENWVSCVSLQDDVIVSGSWDSTVRVWSLAGANPRQVANLLTIPGNAVYSLDRFGNLLATGSHQSRFEVFDMHTNQLLESYIGAHSAKTYSVHFQDSHTLATGGCDGKAKVWDLRSNAKTPSVFLHAHSKAVLSVRMGEADLNPYRLATCSGDHLVKIFDIRMFKPFEQCDLPWWVNMGTKQLSGSTTLSAHSESVFSLCMDDTKLCSGSADGTIKVFRF